MILLKSKVMWFIVGALTVSATLPTTKAESIRYYRFETDNGVSVSNGQTLTAADDSSGNHRAGVPTGTQQYATTPFANLVPSTNAANRSSLLIGAGHGNSEQEGILLSGSSAPVIGQSFTVESFFRLNSTDPATGDSKSIFRIRDAASFAFGLNIVNLDGNGGTNDLILSMNNDTFELYRKNISVNTNYHIAVTCDGATVKLYLDGSLISAGTVPGGFTGSGITSAMIGNDPQFHSAAFQGYLDEFRISDVALSPSQFLDAVPAPAPLPSTAWGGIALLGGLGIKQATGRRKAV